jgi:hypothetical protein
MRPAQWFGIGCVLAGVLGSGSVAAQTAPRFDPTLSRLPPAVSRATVQLLAAPTRQGNAVLRVQFADRRSRGSLVIAAGPGAAPLRDDGVGPDTKAADGVYAAVVQVNAAQFVREQQRRVAWGRSVKTVPVFSGRAIKGYEPFAPAAAVELSAIDARLLDRFRGVPDAVDPKRSLFITATAVVDDPSRTYDACTTLGTPMGAWTFGKLMTEMANQPVTGIHPSDFVEHWMQQFLHDQTINGIAVPAHAMAPGLVLAAWPRLPDGKLDLAQAPFRLQAIVNRQDLRGNALYGAGTGGEARFVFGALKCPGSLAFTVILEYGIDRHTCFEMRSWARQWQDLANLPLGSPAYNAALQAITDPFTLRNAAPAKQPNRSAINQVRSNESSFLFMPGEDGWELRESALTASGHLDNGTTAQTPKTALKAVNLLPVVRDYINQNRADILAGAHTVPLTFPGSTPFRGAAADPGSPAPWRPTGLTDPTARHPFALATCDGCHTLETGATFVHVVPRKAGVAAALSDFLTGLNMPKFDPVTQEPRSFHELLDRQMKLDATANMSCTQLNDAALEDLFFAPQPPSFVH